MKIKRTLISLLCLGVLICLMQFCGRSPSDVPLPWTGAIKISAQIDTVQVDSIIITLDNINQGQFPNGCVLPDIIAGKHQIVASKPDPKSPIDFSSIPKLVAVKANETTNVTLALTKLAPNFTLKNLNNQDVTLADYQGKVVLLVFFSHT